MIKIFQRTIKESTLKELNHIQVGSFVYVEKPTEIEVTLLSEKYGLDNGILRDARDPYEVPRLEVEDGVIYIFNRLPINTGNRVETTPVLIIYHQDFLMVVSRETIPFIDRLTTNKQFYTTQKTKVLIQLLSEINKGYNNFLIEISRKVRNISINIEEISNRDIARFVHFESVINDFLSSLVPANGVIIKLLSGRFFKLYENDKDLIEDLSLAEKQLIDLCRSTLKTIVNIRSAYSTIMTNNLNRVLKILAALTVVLTIPTIVGSFYGMNVALPFADRPEAFGFILALTILLSVLALIIFIKNKWL
ncbi:MAG: magnesium transporter CorA family protein [Candidatus Paceibacterota bacterium]